MIAYLIFMPTSLSKRDVIMYEKLDILSKMAPIREKIKFFEKKYGCNFKDFEERIKRGKEVFEEWDDFIEWKAYLRSFRNLRKRLEELEK